MRQKLESSRTQFIGRAENSGYHWSVVEVTDKHLTKIQAIGGLKRVAVPRFACDGSELTYIYSNTRGVFHLHAVLEKGKWVYKDCVKIS